MKSITIKFIILVILLSIFLTTYFDYTARKEDFNIQVIENLKIKK